MWRLNQPAQTAGPTFVTCISNVENAALKARLEAVEANIVQAEAQYIAAGNLAQLHTIVPQDNIANSVTNAEMVSVYKNRLVPAKSPGRPIYNQLMSIAPHSRCPFCGHRAVSTLDHQLAKTKYSALTVTPMNLIPCCKDCNKAKSSASPQTAEEVYLHPYFDNIENDRWLFANVIQANPASLEFFVQAPQGWSAVTLARVQNQFNKLSLDALYRSNAAEEIINIRGQLQGILIAGDPNAVQAHLNEAYLSRRNARINSWQTASYHAFAENAWFYGGGFN